MNHHLSIPLIIQKDAHLTVFDLSRRTAILLPDARRVAAAFGKAAFINDEDRERRLVHSRDRRGQRLADTSAPFITHPRFVPDGARQPTLHAIWPGEAGAVSQLSAHFLWD